VCINTHTYIYIICIYICIYIYIDRERAGDGGNEYSSEKSYVSYACSHKPVYEYIYIYICTYSGIRPTITMYHTLGNINLYMNINICVYTQGYVHI